jgi:hypothetical protein
MEGTDRALTTWRKSTYSGGNGGDCVEVGGTGCAIVVRDTKDHAGVVLRFGPGAWQLFAATIKDTGKAQVSR